MNILFSTEGQQYLLICCIVNPAISCYMRTLSYVPCEILILICNLWEQKLFKLNLILDTGLTFWEREPFYLYSKSSLTPSLYSWINACSSQCSCPNNKIKLLHGQSADQCIIDCEDNQKYQLICYLCRDMDKVIEQIEAKKLNECNHVIKIVLFKGTIWMNET